MQTLLNSYSRYCNVFAYTPHALQLNSVGGTILYVKAAVHRDGVVFPVANVVGAEWEQQGYTGLETEGICWLAKFLNYKCWGMPDSIVMHASI